MNKKGFTLFEMILVLSVIGLVMLTVRVIPASDWRASMEARLYFDRLRAELEQAQQLAMTSGSRMTIQFDASRNCVWFRPASPYIDEYQVFTPEPWQLQTTFRLSYLPTGRVGNFNQVSYKNTQTGEYLYVTYQLGAGRFEIKRQ